MYVHVAPTALRDRDSRLPLLAGLAVCLVCRNALYAVWADGLLWTGMGVGVVRVWRFIACCKPRCGAQ